MPPPPGAGVGADVEDDVGARVMPMTAVVRLEYRLAVAEQVIGHAEARRRQVPRQVFVDGVELDRSGIVAADGVFLLRRERAIAIEARAEVERQLVADPPRVVNEEAVGPQAAD